MSSHITGNTEGNQPPGLVESKTRQCLQGPRFLASLILSLSDVYTLRLIAGKPQQCQVTPLDSDFQRKTETVFPLCFPLGGKDEIPNAQ